MFFPVYAWHSLVLAACRRFQFLVIADRNPLLQRIILQIPHCTGTKVLPYIFYTFVVPKIFETKVLLLTQIYFYATCQFVVL
jgi:hypothetical protein